MRTPLLESGAWSTKELNNLSALGDGVALEVQCQVAPLLSRPIWLGDYLLVQKLDNACTPKIVKLQITQIALFSFFVADWISRTALGPL